MKSIRAVAFVCCLLFAQTLSAWNDFGHMVVAAIAYQRLTPTTRSRADALLKMNPDYDKWIAGVPEAERAETAFLIAATWPDAIKSMKDYFNDGNQPTGKDAARNIGYADKLQHRYWHYIDLPFSPDGTKVVEPAAPNAATQIAAFRKTIASPDASDELKSYDLVWLLHLVGDVHQPLHCTSRFTKDQPDGDAGGNLVALCAAPCRGNLHAFWDNVLGTSENPRDAEKTAAGLEPADSKRAAVAIESEWVEEGLKAAQNSVYVPPVGIAAGPFQLSGEYKLAAQKLAAERVVLAGARLGNLLNQALR